MKQIIDGAFQILAVVFNKIPGHEKLAGYRSVAGLVGLAVVSLLQAKGLGDPEILAYLNVTLLGYTGLSLNAKGR